MLWVQDCGQLIDAPAYCVIPCPGKYKARIRRQIPGLKVPYIDFDHFLYVSFNAIYSLENTSEDVNSRSFFFSLMYHLSKHSETGGNQRC